MQGEIQASPHWLQIALGLVAAFFTGGGIFKLYDTWLNRKKPAAELHLTQETATEIKVRAHSTAGDSLARMMDRLDKAQATIDRIRSERDERELQAFDLQIELRDSQQRNAQLAEQVVMDNYQMRRQMAFIEMKNLKEEYIAMDKPKESKNDTQ